MDKCTVLRMELRWRNVRFLKDPEALSYGISFARIILTTSFLFGIYYVILNAIQARGAATESLIVNLARQGIIYIPMMFILGTILGEMGLVWAQPITDVLSMILAVWLYIRSEKKEIKRIKVVSMMREQNSTKCMLI